MKTDFKAQNFFARDEALLAHFRSKTPQIISTHSIKKGAFERVFIAKQIADTATLKRLQDALADAYARGISYEDAKGALHKAAALSEHEMKTIFTMNLRTSYNAERKRAQLASSKPYFRYVSVGDSRVRDEHETWHGLILPKDDPFWDSHYPPNGFNCRCKVQAVSEREAASLGGALKPAGSNTQEFSERLASEHVKANELVQVLNEKAKLTDKAGRSQLNKRIKEELKTMQTISAKADEVEKIMQLKKAIPTKVNLGHCELYGKNTPVVVSADTLISHLKHGEIDAFDYAAVPVMLKNELLKKDGNGEGDTLHFCLLGRVFRVTIHKTTSNEARIKSLVRVNKKFNSLIKK